MTQRNRKIQGLDGKAAALLAAGRLSDEEVERIASAPHMLASIRARIESEKAAVSVEPRVIRSRPAVFWLRATVVAAAVLVVAAVGFATFVRFRNQVPNYAYVPAVKVESITPLAPIPVDSYSETRVSESTPKRSNPYVQQAAYRPEPRRVRSVRQAQQEVEQQPLEFYTLPNVQDAAEAAKDARIVTVELPRASLIALGANIPLEGNRQVVKADLLVGPDGVPRAIRLAD